MKSSKVFLCCILIVISGIYTGYGQLPWNALNSGTTSTLNGVDFINADTGIVVGAQGLVLLTTDGGTTWEPKDAGITTDLNAVCFVSESRVFAVGRSGNVIRSDDTGDTWEQIPTGASISLNGISVDRTSGKGLISGGSLALLWTNDFGDNWTPESGGFLSDFFKAYMTGGDFGATFGENSVSQPLIGYTGDGGMTFSMWYFYPVIGGNSVESTAIDGYFFNQDDGFIVGHTFNGLGFITNNINWTTHTWLSQSMPLPLTAIDFNGTDHGVTVGGTADDYILRETFDGGATWDTPEVNGNGKGFNDVVLVGQTGYAIGYNGQIVKKEVPVGIDPYRKESAGMTISPNPVRDKAFLTILLDTARKINLSICNINGQTLQTFPGIDLQSGRHVETLDLDELVPGIYLVKLLSDDGLIIVKKMIVI